MLIFAGCIVFTWDNQTSVPIWNALKMQPVLSDAVSCFKALVTIHKLLVHGPPVVLAEAVGEVSFLEQCARVHASQHGSYGYGPLISSYASFLLTKIDFHRIHPEFTGNFDYEEYLSIKGVQDLDEGYKTIDEMMELQERLDTFQRSVFENFGAAAGNIECRVSAFVPLIDESYGMYKFVTSMLSAMHLSVESPDPLVLLVERYNKIFFCLKEFYAECSKIKYLTSLVAIPQLPSSPPQFTEESLKRFNGSQAFHKATREQPRSEPTKPKESSEKSSKTTVVVQVPAAPTNPAPQPMPMLTGFPAGGYGIGCDPMLMQRITTEVTQMQQSLQIATAQHQADQAALAELKEQVAKAEGRARELTARYNQLAAQANNQSDELRDQIAQWKRKYETTAKLYTELRERYLQLSNRLTEASKSAQYSTALQARLQELEASRLEDAQKLAEREAQFSQIRAQLSNALRELEEFRVEETVIGGEIESQLADEMARAAAEIATAAAKLRDLRSSEAGALHEDLCDAASALTTAIAELVRTARLVQEAIVEAAGPGGDDFAIASFYKRNSVWTAGLISAAQAVASATTHLVSTADELLSQGTKSPEHLIVASTGVTAATAQLIAAARVKANPSWSCAEALEAAAKSVGECNRALVALVTSKADKFSSDSDGTSSAMPMSAQEWKIAEMNQQVEILSLERRLQAARMHLSRLRQSQYSSTHADDSEQACTAELTELRAEDGESDFAQSCSTLAVDDDNELPNDDAWLLTAPPTLEELKL